MCLGVPAHVLEVPADPLGLAVVDMAGTTRHICLAYVPEVEVGDYVLVQNGFAHSIISQDDALGALSALRDNDLLPDSSGAREEK